MMLSLVPPPGVGNAWVFGLKTVGGSVAVLLVGAAFYGRSAAGKVK
jgi:hypothetical protein